MLYGLMDPIRKFQPMTAIWPFGTANRYKIDIILLIKSDLKWCIHLSISLFFSPQTLQILNCFAVKSKTAFKTRCLNLNGHC